MPVVVYGKTIEISLNHPVLSWLRAFFPLLNPVNPELLLQILDPLKSFVFT